MAVDARLRAGDYPRKCLVEKARPEPDFRYFSKRKAVGSLENSTATTSSQGRYFEVCGDRPALWSSSRLRTSEVMPTYGSEGWDTLRRR